MIIAVRAGRSHVYVEWNYKAVELVSYGSVSGALAAEHLRLAV